MRSVVAESVSVFAAGKYLLELSFEAPERWDFGVVLRCEAQARLYY